MVSVFPERCERLVLASSGGLGAEVHPLLRVLSLPGAEALLLALVCRSQLHILADTLAKRLNRSGTSRRRALEEIGGAYASLKEWGNKPWESGSKPASEGRRLVPLRHTERRL